MTDETEVPDFTTNEELESFKAGLSAAEFVGYVTEIGSVVPWTNKSNGHTGTVFKFLLSNNEDNLLHVIAWNEDIARIMPHISSNEIIYLSGLNVTVPKNPIYNKGTKPYELTIRGNTTFTTHGKFYPNVGNNGQRNTPKVDYKNIMNETGYFKSEAYIKTEFRETSLSGGRTMIVGSFTDTEDMVEVRLSTLKVANPDPNKKLEKGDKVAFTAIVVPQEVACIMIHSPNEIEILEKKAIKSNNQLRKGSRLLTKRKNPDDSTSGKKQRVDEPNQGGKKNDDKMSE